MSSHSTENQVHRDAGHKPGTEVINGRYRILRCLGKGGMGDVWLVADGCKGDLPLALKRVRQDKEDSKSASVLRSEYLSLVRLPHPNLVTAFDFEVDQKT